MVSEIRCGGLTGLFIADNVSSVIIYPFANRGSYT